MKNDYLQAGEQKRLRIGVTQRVYKLARNKQESTELFSALYRDIKSAFHVDSYKDIKRKDLQTALRYIDNWRPRKAS
ncbi:ORF6C domain-containing protein [Cytobacillus firmus]|uniref:ORF6C domain-containing protein n=1 Tax=Cytobacillus firmus TaxID=1399 RepID=UPI0036A4C89C